MSRYIDADRLKADLKKKIEEIENEQAPKDMTTLILRECKKNAFREVLNTIHRLHQESTPSKEEIADRIADWISRNPDFFFNGDTKEVMNEIRKLV